MRLYSIKSDGEKPETIVFLHGNSSSSKVYKQIISSKDVAYSRIAFDFLGHGLSPKSKDISDYKMQKTTEIILENILEIEGPIILVGHSYGGHIAIEIAEKIPNLKGLVIFGTPPIKKPFNFMESTYQNEALPTYFTENPSRNQVEEVVNETSSKSDTWNLIVDDFLKTDGVVRAALAQNIEESNVFADEYEIFKNLNVPKLILQGDKEPIARHDYLEMISKEANSEYKIIEDCAHYISVEQPKKFEYEINKFAEKAFNS
jgi:pimeloyl-ACP methyl ester carboxylesterase